MADIFDEILGEHSNPAEVIKRLRREQQLGRMAEISGDKVLSPMGQRMSAGAVDVADGLRKAKMQAQEQAQLAGYRDSTLDLQRSAQDDLRAERDSARGEREKDRALKLAIAQMMAARQNKLSLAQEGVNARHMDSMLAQLSSKVNTSKLGEMSAALKLANTVMGKYPKGDIPGVGGIENIRAGGIGTLATHLPVIGSGADGRDVQSKLAPLQNMMLNIRSGQAVTDPELQRALVEAGLTKFSTDEDLRAALPNIIKTYQQSVNNLTAGYSPEVIAEYRKRGGLKDIDFNTPPEGAPSGGGGDAGGDVSDDQFNALLQQLLQGDGQ